MLLKREGEGGRWLKKKKKNSWDRRGCGVVGQKNLQLWEFLGKGLIIGKDSKGSCHSSSTNGHITSSKRAKSLRCTVWMRWLFCSANVLIGFFSPISLLL
jgi:hypothetical protein